jgi:predicted flap endonuclease-1-like 5' DNA nuclease
MGYLFIQTWIWLLLAALLGLFVGWLVWRKSGSGDVALQQQLDECKRRCTELESANIASSHDSVDPGASEDDTKPKFLSQPMGAADDLKRISGVGPVLEKTLNDLGIFHFQQIAELDKENIDWVDNYLSFTGRIEREDWVGQAKKLATGEATEFADKYDDKP